MPANPRAPARTGVGHHLLIAPDKFKGTLSALDACAAITRGWWSVRPVDSLDLLPMSDGGEGFGEVLAQLLGADQQTALTANAAHQPMAANWWWEPRRRLAIIESARVIGLAMLPKHKFHPFQLDTFGLGRVLMDAANQGAEQVLIGIGGSATNDGGFGLARALGWKFLDPRGRELEQWWQLPQLTRTVPPKSSLGLRVTVAVDVQNPLLGKSGCSRIFGPQKGLRPDDIVYAEKCLCRLRDVLRRQLGIDCAGQPGAGAAGGLGFGFMAFLGAQPRSGFEVFAQAADLRRRIRQAGLVITGEGALDHQTHMGKGVGEIGRLCRELEVPCAALAGIAQEPASRKLFWTVRTLTDITNLTKARREPARYLEQLAAALAGEFSRSGRRD